MKPIDTLPTAGAEAAASSERSTPRFFIFVECLGVFVLGFALMTFFFHASAGTPGGEIGVREHDSFYHVKMAAMLPQVGLLEKFPWLQYAYFRDEGGEFVSHHVGFHALLVPFVQLSHALTGDYLAGGRWAMAFFLGLNLVLFNLLLREAGVPYRWLWIVLFIFLPDQFFARHASVRAIGPSLVIMQLLLLCLFRGRYVWAGLALAAYVHLYLGAVMYGPVVVAIYALALVLAPSGRRRIPGRMLAWTIAGWLLGVLTYPYAGGMFEFLKLQVFGTGLSPDIEVGQEWKPYTDAWFLVRMSSVVLAVWFLALGLRLGIGPRLNDREWTLIILQFVFLLLTFKARRFIEYWPYFCLLSAAYVSVPTAAAIRDQISRCSPRTRRTLSIVSLSALTVAFAIMLAAAAHRPETIPLVAEWRLWAAVLAALLLAPLTHAWFADGMRTGDRLPLLRLLAVPACGAAVVGLIALLVRLGYAPPELPPARLRTSALVWALLAAAYLSIPAATWFLVRPQTPVRVRRAAFRSTLAVLLTVASAGGVGALGASHVKSIAHQSRCYYDLADVRGVMDCLKQNSQPGDVVFTDDWDVFPVFFYHNTHNHYIVGLDPKFTHQRRPDLWERYVKITRGQAPTRSSVVLASNNGRPQRQSIDIALEDIRDEFKADFVITDRDHKKLAEALAKADDLAELIYPSVDYATARDAPYLLFRIRAPGEGASVAGPPMPDARGRLYLGSLRAASVEQGWGRLLVDRSVERRALKIAGRVFTRGLGTHAPSKLVYDVPTGYTAFEAWVGVDDETGGAGSIVASVWLDDRHAFESPTIRGGDEPVAVRIPLGDAKRITLQADPTADGKRFDHVDWADAALVQAGMGRAAGSSVLVANPAGGRR